MVWRIWETSHGQPAALSMQCALRGLAGFCRGEQIFSVPLIRTKTKLAAVPVSVGRRRLTFVADTGARNTMIASEALGRLAPDDFQVRGATYMGFAGGERLRLVSPMNTPDRANVALPRSDYSSLAYTKDVSLTH